VDCLAGDGVQREGLPELDPPTMLRRSDRKRQRTAKAKAWDACTLGLPDVTAVQSAALASPLVLARAVQGTLEASSVDVGQQIAPRVVRNVPDAASVIASAAAAEAAVQAMRQYAEAAAVTQAALASSALADAQAVAAWQAGALANAEAAAMADAEAAAARQAAAQRSSAALANAQASTQAGPSNWLLNLLDNAAASTPSTGAATTRVDVVMGDAGADGTTARTRLDALLSGIVVDEDPASGGVQALLRGDDNGGCEDGPSARSKFEHQRIRAAAREAAREAASQAAEFFLPGDDGLPWGASFTFRALPEDVPPPNRNFDDDVRDAKEFRRVSGQHG